MPVYQHVVAVIFGRDKPFRIGAEIAHDIVGMAAAIVELRFVEPPVYLFGEVATGLDTHADVDLSRIDIESFIEFLLRQPGCTASPGRKYADVVNLFFGLAWLAVMVVFQSKLV